MEIPTVQSGWSGDLQQRTSVTLLLEPRSLPFSCSFICVPVVWKSGSNPDLVIVRPWSRIYPSPMTDLSRILGTVENKNLYISPYVVLDIVRLFMKTEQGYGTVLKVSKR